MTKRIAIIGGGPIGVEAAARATQRGFDVDVFERGAVGSHVARWGHVPFFSPWELNRSPWGAALLREQGHELAPDDEFPTGREYLRNYLHPLIEAAGLSSKIHNLTTVRGVARRGVYKGDLIGHRDQAGPFIVAVSGPDSPGYVEADILFDASGVYGQPSPFGIGGLEAQGESELASFIERWIPDPQDRDTEAYAGKHVLVIGDGYSAATSLDLLVGLRETAPKTRISWVLGVHEPPYVEMADDPLPQRLELARFGNRAATGGVDGITPIRLQIERLDRAGDRVAVTFSDGSSIDVDRIVSNVGYRPDMALTRELQVHHCYASEGPMKLAASLLAQAGNADCLAQESAGLDTLRSPETDFFVIGGKSYGRNSNFLLRVGFEQIEAILADYD